MKSRYGSLYKDLDIARGNRLVLLTPMCFLLRRLHMVWLVIYGSGQALWHQMAQVIAITGLIVLMPYWLRSFKEKRQKW